MKRTHKLHPGCAEVSQNLSGPPWIQDVVLRYLLFTRKNVPVVLSVTP